MAKLHKYLDWKTWIRGLWSAVIQGGSGAVLGSLGILGENLAGVDIKPLEYKQMAAVFVGAAVIRLLFFLSQHPAPDEETEAVSTPPFKPEVKL